MIVLACSVGFGSPVEADFLVNGGFETGSFSGWTLNGNTDFNFVQSGFSHSGNYAAWFGEPGALGTLSQSFNTTPGGIYSLSFWFAGFGDDPSAFIATANSVVLLDLINPEYDLDYQFYTFQFQADTPRSTISFAFRDDFYYVNLDDVSIAFVGTAVPEPAALTAFGIGVVMLASYKLFRAKQMTHEAYAN